MRTRSILAIAVALLAAAGGWLARGWLGAGGEAAPRERVAAGPCPGGAKPLHWKAPMDPSYVRDEPGKSPMGMDLVPVCPGADAADVPGVVRIEPALVQNMGVRLAQVARRDVSRTVRAVGRVAYDEQRVTHVHTKVQGWVEKLHIDYEGQLVDRGEPLLEIYSPELVATQEELLVAARYREQTAESPFEDVQESGAHLFEATRRRLTLWDIPQRDIDRLLETGSIRKNLTLYSPAGGVVTHLMVREGMEVGPNQNLYTIADLSRVWIYAEVYEYELPWIAVGQKAIVDLGYLPGTTFETTVTYVYPFLDPKTRTIRVRLEVANPELFLKPDMFANVRIFAQVRRDTLAVPDEAVLRSGKRSLVIVALGEGRFEPRHVRLGVDSGDGWLEVLEGLAEGEQIVASGQFLIDSESRLREVARKLLESGGAGAAAAAAGHGAHGMPGKKGHAGHAMSAGSGGAGDEAHGGAPRGEHEASGEAPHADQGDPDAEGHAAHEHGSGAMPQQAE